MEKNIDGHYYYAVFVCEDDKKEILVWKSSDGGNKWGRVYFIGGAGIFPCIFQTAPSAYSEIKKMHKDFDEGAQFYVRKITIRDYPEKLNQKEQ